MTRVTVYGGAPYDDENEVIADYFYNEDNPHPVRVEASGGQEIHFDTDEWVDVYIDGEQVDE